LDQTCGINMDVQDNTRMFLTKSIDGFAKVVVAVGIFREMKSLCGGSCLFVHERDMVSIACDIDADTQMRLLLGTHRKSPNSGN